MEDLYHYQNELDERKSMYDLEGVEITEEDAQQVIDFINNGYTEDEAFDAVLMGIRDCVSEGWEY